MGRHMTKVAYEWTATTLSYLRVDTWPKLLWVNGHNTKLPTGRCVAKVAYGWTVTTLSHLQVDAWPKSTMGGRWPHLVTLTSP